MKIKARLWVMIQMQADRQDALRSFFTKNGMKNSRQRELIAATFFNVEGHLSIDELLERVRAEDPRVGLATVYRTMKLLAKAGLAEVRRFGDGQTRYEQAHADTEHHDHLICTSCGKIVEFVNPEIEALQARVAAQHGFVVQQHKMELYGVCAGCRDRQ